MHLAEDEKGNLDIPTEINIRAYVSLKIGGCYSELRFDFFDREELYSNEPEENVKTLTTMDITIKIPDVKINTREGKIESIKAQIEKAQAEHVYKINNLENILSSLTAIEYQPSEDN